jgi:hypothetical protein
MQCFLVSCRVLSCPVLLCAVLTTGSAFSLAGISPQDLKAKLEAASKGIITADPESALGQALQ